MALSCAAMFGCGSKVDVVPVSGYVHIDGKPAENIAVSFTPIPGQSTPGPTSSGITDSQGQFTLSTVQERRISGAVPGKHRVMLNRRIPDLDQFPYGEAVKKVAQANRALPVNTRDGSLTYEVPAGGTDQADFRLTSKR
jgi:hypothetical protein